MTTLKVIHSPVVYAWAHIRFEAGVPHICRQSGHLSAEILEQGCGQCQVAVVDAELAEQLKGEICSIHILPSGSSPRMHSIVTDELPAVQIHTYNLDGERSDRDFDISIYGPRAADWPPPVERKAAAPTEPAPPTTGAIVETLHTSHDVARDEVVSKLEEMLLQAKRGEFLSIVAVTNTKLGEYRMHWTNGAMKSSIGFIGALQVVAQQFINSCRVSKP